MGSPSSAVELPSEERRWRLSLICMSTVPPASEAQSGVRGAYQRVDRPSIGLFLQLEGLPSRGRG
eukprot:1194099-Prorocentrum_minimum.AAC.2